MGTWRPEGQAGPGAPCRLSMPQSKKPKASAGPFLGAAEAPFPEKPQAAPAFGPQSPPPVCQSLTLTEVARRLRAHVLESPSDYLLCDLGQGTELL